MISLSREPHTSSWQTFSTPDIPPTTLLPSRKHQTLCTTQRMPRVTKRTTSGRIRWRDAHAGGLPLLRHLLLREQHAPWVQERLPREALA